MYSAWPCPRVTGGTVEEMMLGFDQARELRLLVIAPLFDEANKFRRQTLEIMRRLDAEGIDSFLPDLPGCNESSTPLTEQSLATWRSAAMAAAKHIRATHCFAIRSGCWLAPPAVPGWLYAPAKPKQVLRGMVRARTLAAREAGREETAETLMAEARIAGIELSGWQLGHKLVRELEAGEFAPAETHILIEQAVISGAPLWLRAEPDEDAAQADALAGVVANGMLGA
ncbi:hypothetical protein [Qipengyuania marisflavi]|uniref:Uncharacterized protein n=1 Tax=Qipengyuania marisflavi TaxID=2486356 RepID=A0A5S3P9A3_9SPHN|nr:hypothetical protein [Qipengyuania marisflavi]TMM50031.1 hypothetical protein FEV51_02205 [Qipengyuania marisflavi]